MGGARRIGRGRFNEAPALRAGESLAAMVHRDPPFGCFNEAPALRAGERMVNRAQAAIAMRELQ